MIASASIRHNTPQAKRLASMNLALGVARGWASCDRHGGVVSDARVAVCDAGGSRCAARAAHRHLDALRTCAAGWARGAPSERPTTVGRGRARRRSRSPTSDQPGLRHKRPPLDVMKAGRAPAAPGARAGSAGVGPPPRRAQLWSGRNWPGRPDNLRGNPTIDNGTRWVSIDLHRRRSHSAGSRARGS
jgi:hypothetical protein